MPLSSNYSNLDETIDVRSNGDVLRPETITAFTIDNKIISKS